MQNSFQDRMSQVGYNIKTNPKSIKMYEAQKRNIYVSVGDINGVGLELILRNHHIVEQYFNPIYCVSFDILQQASKLLSIPLPSSMRISEVDSSDISISPRNITKESGAYSFKSFESALSLSIEHKTGLITLPISKHAWNLANIKYAGHTDYLREKFQKNAIMMLGCKEMFVALFTDHIPLKDVPARITKDSLIQFLKDLYSAIISQKILKEFSKPNIDKSKLRGVKDILRSQILHSKMIARLLKPYKNSSSKINHLEDEYIKEVLPNHANLYKIAVLGLNPHAGDGGVIGDEDLVIGECIQEVNEMLQKEVFVGPIAPDSAFTPHNRQKYQIFVAMYHDSGLSVLKALYFYKSINISLNLPILRVSPDHGTGFDIAYSKKSMLDSRSYLESAHFITSHI
ncbi:4-hydroxythreonine-4-phosphate dehydrogenase PdxA [Helicobacter muridarum]|uniref:4-hydroxythreonine-4-phosphate dehydrogenase n=2 Tax=Helicobacter muridarum TaxID=216 RepID=A0A377PVE2_9HELI|nr:4-hydroxythreonine-4-phosphate dehydrogenase PdxA [Helicobacter muridarum]STQ86382.1 4-hydroxythreonine-4-phosphate dehydrogenase [Helicobacter muridarum]